MWAVIDIVNFHWQKNLCKETSNLVSWWRRVNWRSTSSVPRGCHWQPTSRLRVMYITLYVTFNTPSRSNEKSSSMCILESMIVVLSSDQHDIYNVSAPDTYVKTYLVGNGKRLQKRRTKTAKESTDPLYRQKLKYSACNVHGRHMQVNFIIEISLCKRLLIVIFN